MVPRYHFGPSIMVTPDKGSGCAILGIVYIYEVHEARNVKYDAQVAMNKISDPVQK